jgi:tetratricopeptide (TPR) repeat protein
MDYPAGGYPVAAAMVEIHGEEQMDKKPEAHFRWITAHEIGHMYWSQYVLAAGEDDLNWLMVGLGIFADREYRRARGIPEPIGLLADNYTGGLAQGIDTTMDLTAEQEEVISWEYNNVVEHGKSSAMMDALESNIGAGVFDRAYRRTLREFHGRRLGWRDFERICEEESGEDLDWFFESWVRTNQYAFYRAVKTSSGEVDVVSEGTLRERVPVVATFEDGTQQTQFTDRLAEGTRFRFNGSSPLKEVKIDPRNTLWMPDAAPPLTSLALELKIARMNVTGTAEEALQLLPRAREVGLAESLTWRHLGLMLYDGKRYAEALECLRKALDTTTDNDYRFLALVWQGQLLDLTGDRTAAIAAYQAAHATASKQVFRHDQYKLVIDQAWVEQRLQTPFVRQ